MDSEYLNSLPYDRSSWSILRYFKFEPSYKLWCSRARDLFGSQIPLTTGGFELQISCIRSSYLTHYAIRPNRLGRFGVPEFATLRQEYLIYIEILQVRAKFQTLIVLCSRFIWITNSRYSCCKLVKKLIFS